MRRRAKIVNRGKFLMSQKSLEDLATSKSDKSNRFCNNVINYHYV